MKKDFDFKWITVILLLIVSLTVSLQNTQAQCDTSDPVQELPWIGEVMCEVCVDEVIMADYNGQTVFIAEAGNYCADFPTNVYNCDGEVICFFGGFIGSTGEDCPELYETMTNQQNLGLEGCCEAYAPIVTLPYNTICTSGFAPPIMSTGGIELINLPANTADGFGWFVIDEEENIVIPIDEHTELEFWGFSGSYCIMGINYDTNDPYDANATTLTELLNGGGCFAVAACMPSNTLLAGGSIPYLEITTEPECNNDGSFDVGFTVTGSSGTAEIFGMTVANGEEFFINYTTPDIELWPPIDTQFGCANDFIEIVEGPTCPVIAACVDSSLIVLNPICPGVFEPVCGCNGQTYNNECFAVSDGLTSWSQGECSTSTVTICQGDFVQLGENFIPNTLYNWTPSDSLTCSNCPDPYANPSETTTYILATSFTSPIPEYYYAVYEVIVEDCDTIDAVIPLELLGVTWYPNPVQDRLLVDLGDAQVSQLKLYNIYGQVVIVQQATNPKMEIDLTHLTKGIYFLEFFSKAGNSRIEEVLKM